MDIAEIKQLSVDDRLCLVEAIWDTIVADAEEPTITEAQKAELDRRLADYRQTPGRSFPGNR